MRHRNWVLAGVLVLAVIAAGVLAGHGKGPNAGGAGQPRVSFGSQVQPLGATSDLVYTNGWVASLGTEAIGVYAGAQRSRRRDGLLVIMRNHASGQRIARLVVPGSGAVTLLRPARPTSEDAALQETLHFVTANGGTGTLELSGDRVALSH